MGKAADYDPRRDSAVRIQVGRLRQKLAEYYRTEGKDDPCIIELPKGRFKLNCELRAAVAESVSDLAPKVDGERRWRKAALLLAAALVLVSGWTVFATIRLVSERREFVRVRADWTPELEALWQPFLASERPLVISIADPLFIQFKGFGAYRDFQINGWDEAMKSPAVATIRKALGNVEVQSFSYYATLGEVNACFLLGKLLAPRLPHIALVKSTELSWQQLADNNVLFIGAERIFRQQLRGLPVELQLLVESPGVRSLHPKPGEPAVFADRLPTPGGPEDGEIYALISHTPGPNGQGDIESFNSNRTAGRVAAVQWFTDAAHAQDLLAKLKTASGEIPRYFQVLLKVKFKDGVPTETSYVLDRELRANGQAGSKN
jgi:hypothetical protein